MTQTIHTGDQPPPLPGIGELTTTGPSGALVIVSAPAPTTKIILDHDQSAVLTNAGAQAFTITGRQSYPGDPTRWILHLAPLEWKTALDAAGVLAGSHRASRIKTSVSAKTSVSSVSTPSR